MGDRTVDSGAARGNLNARNSGMDKLFLGNILSRIAGGIAGSVIVRYFAKRKTCECGSPQSAD